jgi:glycosyltransferase involved in cell wall biosynthesis
LRIIIDARGLSTNYEKRGVGYHIKSLMQGLPRAAPQIHFIFFIGDPSAARYLPDRPNVESVLIKRSWKYGWLEDLAKLPFEIRRARADLFHSPIVLGPIRDINIPLWSPVPVIATVHDLHVEILDDPYMESYRRETRYKVQRWAVRKTRILTVSEFTRNLVAASGLAGKRDIRVIPNCVPETARPASVEKENMILFIGDAAHKNVSNVISVLKALSTRVQGWKFVMVGSRERILSLGGLYAKELQAARILQIEEDVPDEIFDAIFAKAKLLFMPSLSEGFGVPVLQAFAAGTCVVVSDRGALPEVGGDAAVYVDPEDCLEMVSTLEGLTKNPTLQAALTQKGKRRVKKFLCQEHFKKLVKIYTETAGHE